MTQLAQLGAGDAEVVGEAAAQGDGEPAPQFGGVPVERDLSGVVVAVRAQRRAEVGVVVAVDAGACTGRPCGQNVAAGRGGGGRARPGPRVVCTGPNDGAVRVAKTSGCAATVSGTSLMPPAVPA